METADVVASGGLVIGGATLKWIADAAMRIYQSGKPQKIEQPIAIEKLEHPTPMRQCDERHHDIKGQTDNLFARMTCAEQRISSLEATQVACEKRLTSIDNKLDVLLKRK